MYKKYDNTTITIKSRRNHRGIIIGPDEYKSHPNQLERNGQFSHAQNILSHPCSLKYVKIKLNVSYSGFNIPFPVFVATL